MATKKTKIKKLTAAEKAKATLAKKAKKGTPKGAKTCKQAGSDLRIFKTSKAGRKLAKC